MPGVLTAQSAFETAVQSIVDTNADLQARHSRYLSDIEAEKAENQLNGPEAELEYKFAPSGVENRWGVSVSQAFDWPGLYGARRKTARYNAEAFRMLYEADRNAVALEARTLLLDYIQALHNVALLTEAENNLRSLDENLSKAYERESATILMVKKTRRELFEISGRRADAESTLLRIKETLKAMGDGNVILDGVTTFPDSPLRPLADYRATMLIADPTLAAHSRLIDAADAGISVNKAGRLPSFSLGYVHDYEEGFHFNGFSVGISLPSWGKSHSTSAAKAAALAAGFGKEDYAQNLEANLVADWNEAQDLARRLVPVKNEFAGDNYLELLAKSYDGGQITIFEYLREINEYIDFKINLTELEHRYNTVLARLNRYNTTAAE